MAEDDDEREIAAITDAAHELTLVEAVDRAIYEFLGGDESPLSKGSGVADPQWYLDRDDIEKMAGEIAMKLNMAGFGKR
jgi:hypothetical protein